MKKGLGFDPKTLDKKVAPEDDFFKYVNAKWLKQNPIPKAESRWGSFIVLRYDTERQLKKLAEKTTHPLIKNIYRAALDMKHRNLAGVKPLRPLLSHIEGIKDVRGLTAVIAELHRLGIDAPFGPGVDQDLKRSSHYILYLGQAGLGMPDRDYYLKDGPEQKRVREAYRKHIVKIFKLLKMPGTERKRDTVMRIETMLAKASMDKVSMRDPHKIYHKKSRAELARLAPGIAWKAYFPELGLKQPQPLIVCQPEFMKSMSRMLQTLPLADWKTYLTFHVANDLASSLSQPFVNESFSFYGKVLSGQKKQKPLWRRALGAVNGSVGEEFGKLYVKHHFTAAAKRKMNILVSELFEAYEERIKNLDWMSAATKRKALKKLAAIGRKIGYPSKWRSYKGLVARKDDHFGNMVRAELHEHRRQMRKVGRPVERHEWHMTPQTVNAYYTPTLNEIVFPAAILQPPFFDFAADDAVNYGAIGSVIGHEITHGFDDEGSKFDAVGNLKLWWTKSDRKRFDKKAALLAKHYDRYTVAPGIHVNGKLTLGENIADLGGASIAYDAYQRRLKKTGRKTIKGFTPEERFFIGWAQAEREQGRPEYLKMIVVTDTHSPSRFRINGPASNMDEFYRTFKVTKKNKLYRPTSARARIW